MLSVAAVPALLPTFINEWSLSKTDAGWLNGTYYLGYLLAVPFLFTLTDRRPAHSIYFVCMALSGFATLGYAFFADGFWTALVFRLLSGIGLAGTYMPGLKLLTDQLERINPGADHSRSVAFYTSSFGIGMSLSYFLAGELAELWDWRWAFTILGIGPLLALAYMAAILPRQNAAQHAQPTTHLLDFRPVFRCRPAMGYVLAYTVHNFELFAFRSWVVAYLAFALTRHPGESLVIAATAIAAASNVVGLPASVLGNEMARRIGRHRAITLIMWTSALFAVGLGFMLDAPLWVITIAVIAYGVLITGDSSSITAGAVAEAPPGYKGATLAVHACIGFTGSFLGPLAFGAMLDISSPTGIGGDTIGSWVWAFGMAAAVAALGPVFLYLLRKR
ncbi:MAG: MFS transporter [Rhodospirillaceae bacterium]|nr:MFS transporter [Rhodospirillaceae bacterium]